MADTGIPVYPWFVNSTDSTDHSFTHPCLLNQEGGEASRVIRHRWVQIPKSELRQLNAAISAQTSGEELPKPELQISHHMKAAPSAPPPTRNVPEEDGQAAVDVPLSQKSDATCESLERELGKLVDEAGADAVGGQNEEANDVEIKDQTEKPEVPEVREQPEAPVPDPCQQLDQTNAKAPQTGPNISHSEDAAEAITQVETQHKADEKLVKPVKLEQQESPDRAQDAAEALAKSHQPRDLPAPKCQKQETKAEVSTTSAPELPASFFVDPKRNKKVVRSMAEAFMFEADCIDTLWDEEGDAKIHSLLDAMRDDTMSTAFSGIEAAGTSMQCLRKALANIAGVDVPRQEMLYQIEWNKECQSELLLLAKRHGTCLFPNIALFYRDELQGTIQACLQRPQMAVEVLGPLIATGKAMKLEAHCLTHNRCCSLKPSRRHVAGTSCKPWSKKGSGLGAADPEIVYTLAWVGLRLALQDDEVLSENVTSPGGSASTSDGKPVADAGLGSLLLRFLSPLYFMETTILDPALIGEPFSRQREFVKMRHREKCLQQVSPISRFQKRFFKVCEWSWKSAVEKSVYYIFYFLWKFITVNG